MNDISKEYDFPATSSYVEKWHFFYDNTKPDIVISVIFPQNEDLVVTYWNIE